MSSVYTGSCNKDFQQWDFFKACFAQESYLFNVWIEEEKQVVKGTFILIV
jgi:hypothetical protein